MVPTRAFLIAVTLVFLCAPLSPQTRPQPVSRVPAAAHTSPALSARQVIEHHFESAHPVARRQLQGAVPGAKIIAAHDARRRCLLLHPASVPVSWCTPPPARCPIRPLQSSLMTARCSNAPRSP